MSISRQNGERLWGAGGAIVFFTGRVRRVCAQKVLFCIVSASSLPHISKDRGGGAEKISVSRTGICGVSIPPLGSLRWPMFLRCFTPCF